MTPREECEGIMDGLIGTAEELLQTTGEFHPFAATLDADGQLQRFSPSGIPSEPDIVGWLVASLKDHVAASPGVRATCIVALVSVERPGTQDSVDAIRMALDHQQDYATQVFFPYRLTEGEPGPAEAPAPREVTFGDAFATRGVSYAFRGEPYRG
jgi:hypothetical protein